MIFAPHSTQLNSTQRHLLQENNYTPAAAAAVVSNYKFGARARPNTKEQSLMDSDAQQRQLPVVLVVAKLAILSCCFVFESSTRHVLFFFFFVRHELSELRKHPVAPQMSSPNKLMGHTLLLELLLPLLLLLKLPLMQRPLIVGKLPASHQYNCPANHY